MTASRAMRDQRTVDQRFDHPTKSPEARAINDIREDVEAGFSILEARSGSYPRINSISGTVPKYGGDLVIRGANLVQSQSFASLTLGTGTAELVITALKPGVGGNSFTIALEDGETAGSEVVTKTGNAFVIGIEAGTSTADQIATAINAADADSDGYIRCNGGGSGTPVVVAATALAGGAGEGFVCSVNGQEALPANTAGADGAAALAETACTVTVPDISATTESGDPVIVSILSDGVLSNEFIGSVSPQPGEPVALDWLDGASITATGGDIVLEGRNLLQNQTFDTLTLWADTSAVVITALKPGDSGFNISITDGATAGSEVVTKTGANINIQIQVGTSTADQIATAINANDADSDGYITADGAGSGTTNAIQSATDLAGGVGQGFVVRVGGTEALPANTTGANGGAAIDDGTATVTVPDLTADSPAKAATDEVAVTIESDGVVSGQLTVELA